MKINRLNMTPDRYARLSAVFDDLADAPEAERERGLEALERDDSELAHLVRRMLELDRQSTINGEWFSSPIVDIPRIADDARVNEDDRACETLPASIGPYRVISRLGWGSVGDVYLCKQRRPIERNVAVKVLRLHARATQQERYAIEAKVLSSLSHPGIAQIFDAGVTGDDRPYLVMEYVDGDTIVEACRKHGLALEQKLHLIIDLCDAVQYAHQQGVIHRDLKPGNVLVSMTDGRPHIKVIDFGIARILGPDHAVEQPLTLHGQMLGTLDYMSPEQWRGQRADTRSDVYAIGVLLHHVLTGRPPFDGRPASMIRGEFVKEGFSGAMREVPHRIRRDVETIVRKSLAHEPSHRYPSPSHQADDVTRVLEGRPVEARRPSLMDRTVKLCRRHPWTAGLSALLCVIIIGLVSYVVVTRQMLSHETDVQRELIVGLLDDVLDRLHSLTGAMETRDAMARSLLVRTDQLLRISPHDAHLLEAKARLLMEIGNVHADRHEFEHAAARFEEAIGIMVGIVTDSTADVEAFRRHAYATVRLANAVYNENRQRSLQLKDDAHTILLDLAERYPQHPGVLDDLCWSHDRLAWEAVLRREDQYAQQLLDQRLDLSYRLIALDPERTLSVYNLASAHYQLSRYYSRQGDFDSVWHHIEQAVGYGERVIAAEPVWLHCRHNFVQILMFKARTAMALGDSVNAQSVFERIDAETLQLLHENPHNSRVIQLRASYMIKHALTMCRHLEPEQAEQLYLAACEAADRWDDLLNNYNRDLLNDLRREFTETQSPMTDVHNTAH